MSGEPSRTALVVIADDADEAVAGWRARHDRSAVAQRIPPHVTILFPFVPAADIEDPLLSRLRALYAPVAPFGYELARVESFPGTAWLAPEPSAPFHGLVARTRGAFPDHPPYGDPTLEPVPHCTIGVADDPAELERMLAELRAGLDASLPIRSEARAVALLEEHADATWSPRAAFRLEGDA